MSTVKVKLSPWFKKLIYIGLSISWVTGLAFFIMNNWITVEGDFGSEKHPMQFNVLMVHGAAAFLMLMVFGSMLSNHIPKSWKTKRLRKIGISLTSFIILQTFSAYLLYYLSDEYWRSVTSWIHLGVGVSLPFLLWFHIVLGKRRYS